MNVFDIALAAKLDAAKVLATPIIQHFEASDKCHLDSYIIPGEKQATIAWGHAIPLSMHPMKCTQAQGDAWLNFDITIRMNKFKSLVPRAVQDKMTAGQIAMFISWSYNAVGSWQTSDSFRLLQRGNILGWIDGADEWNKGADPHHPGMLAIMAGLVRRRAVERHVAERGSIDEVRKLNWYRDLIACVADHHVGHLAWFGQRLKWNPS